MAASFSALELLATLKVLASPAGRKVRGQYWREKLAGGRGAWAMSPPTVGFVVTAVGDDVKAGDTFTALELAAAIESELGWHTRLLPRTDPVLDCADVDVLVVMMYDYDVRRVDAGAKANLLRVAWMRARFDQWPEQPWFAAYDLYLASSALAKAYVEARAPVTCHVLPIAANAERFGSGERRPEYAFDYCFTGNYWGAPRSLAETFDPGTLPYRFGVFGANWRRHPSFARFDQGGLPYAELPHLYASTPIVLDDATDMCGPYGSVNSRVFDALAAGALVLTNGAPGAVELFGGKLPVYGSAEDLAGLLRTYVEAPDQRAALAEDLRAVVLGAHTYRHRARSLRDILQAFFAGRLRIAIKTPVPSRAVAESWGDWHFAVGLRDALTRRGHAVRIDVLDEWDTRRTFFDDAVIVLRGLSAYRPLPGQISVMWNISHPEAVSAEEYGAFDHVFIASADHARTLAGRLKVPVTALLQCADPNVFKATGEPLPEAPAVLFVGNSRRQERAIVRDALAAGVDLAIWGADWEGRVPPGTVRGANIANTELHRHYRGCGVLLNDHWPAMRDLGFLSNRLFDAGAAGAFVISDAAAGMEDVFGDAVVTYRDAADLGVKLPTYLADDAARRTKAKRLQDIVLGGHTFDHRADDLLAVLTRLRAASG